MVLAQGVSGKMVGRKQVKIPILKKLKAGTKIIQNATEIIMDIQLPLDREDYNFLKEMHNLNISVRGRYILNNQIVGFFNNSIKSISSYDLNKKQLE